LDAIEYIDQRNKILQKLPDTNEILLISPSADMEEMAEEDVTYLRFFHGGQSISGYLDSFDESDIKLLKQVRTLLDHKFLMTREEFDSLVAQQEQMAENAGIKNVIKNIFKRKPAEVEKRKKIASPEDLEELNLDEDSTDMNETTFIKMVLDDKIDLKHIKNKIKKL
jgi:hypothetical protein